MNDIIKTCRICAMEDARDLVLKRNDIAITRPLLGEEVIFKRIECRDDQCLISSSKHTAFAFTFSRGRDEHETPSLSLLFSFSLSYLPTTIAVEINYLLAGYSIGNHCVLRASEASKSWRMSCGFCLLILKRENGTAHESLETRHHGKKTKLRNRS